MNNKELRICVCISAYVRMRICVCTYLRMCVCVSAYKVRMRWTLISELYCTYKRIQLQKMSLYTMLNPWEQ